MIKFILGFFGYIKIPKEVVQLSVTIEKNIEKVYNVMTVDNNREYMSRVLAAQKTLTSFLKFGCHPE